MAHVLKGTCGQEYATVGWDLSIPALVPHRLVVHPKCSGLGVGKLLVTQAEVVSCIKSWTEHCLPNSAAPPPCLGAVQGARDRQNPGGHQPGEIQ